MGKFGFGKKDDAAAAADDSSQRSALFGSRSKDKKTSTNPSQNPYANIPQPSDAYNNAKARAGVPGYNQVQRGPSPNPPGGGAYGAPPPGGDRYGGGGGGGGGDRYGVPPPAVPGKGGYPDDKKGYGGMNGGAAGYQYQDDAKAGRGGYGADKYGAQGGYGGDRYGSSGRGGGAPEAPSKYGAGGYGGMGRAPSSSVDEEGGRDALFGGARDRVQKRTGQQMGYGGGGGGGSQYGGSQPPPYDEVGDEFNTGRDGPPEPEYEAYGDRQLTAEEEEEEDVTATKQQIRFIKQEDVSSTRNALRIAAQAEETGMNTLARIGAQGERIHNTEKNLDLTSNHNRMAEDKAKELKTLNRSMFAVHVSNPFTAGSRAEKRDMDVLERHHLEREQREATRRQGYETDQRMQKTFKGLEGKGKMSAAQMKEASLAERAKFQFEVCLQDLGIVVALEMHKG